MVRALLDGIILLKLTNVLRQALFLYHFTNFQPIIQASTQSQASQLCKSLNSTLASIHSVEENDFIISLVPSYPAVDWYNFWIGYILYNRTSNWYTNERLWSWEDGTSNDWTLWNDQVENVSLWVNFEFWGNNKPTYDAPGLPYEKVCAVLSIDGTNKEAKWYKNGWIDKLCDVDLINNYGELYQGAICQRYVQGYVPSTTVDPYSRKRCKDQHFLDYNCEKNWTFYEQTKKCYYVSLFMVILYIFKVIV